MTWEDLVSFLLLGHEWTQPFKPRLTKGSQKRTFSGLFSLTGVDQNHHWPRAWIWCGWRKMLALFAFPTDKNSTPTLTPVQHFAVVPPCEAEESTSGWFLYLFFFALLCTSSELPVCLLPEWREWHLVCFQFVMFVTLLHSGEASTVFIPQ